MDRYDIESRFAAGPAGVTYRGIDVETGQRVALKVLVTDDATHPFDAAAILADAPQLAALGALNVVRLLDVVPDDDGMMLVYEWFDGRSALTVAAEQVIGAAEALDVAAQLLSGLAMAERLRLPHGDIKASNVLLAWMPEGRWLVKMTDWGLSAFRSEHPAETLWFRAPERLDGHGPTWRAEIFSVGMVLFHLLTGMTLVAGGDTREVAEQWKRARLPDLRKLRPDLPAPFSKWIARLLSLKASARPATPTQARAELSDFMPPPPPMIRPAGR